MGDCPDAARPPLGACSLMERTTDVMSDTPRRALALAAAARSFRAAGNAARAEATYRTALAVLREAHVPTDHDAQRAVRQGYAALLVDLGRDRDATTLELESLTYEPIIKGRTAMTVTTTELLNDDMLARFDERAPVYDRENRFFDEDWAELVDSGYLLATVPDRVRRLRAGTRRVLEAGPEAGIRRARDRARHEHALLLDRARVRPAEDRRRILPLHPREGRRGRGVLRAAR